MKRLGVALMVAGLGIMAVLWGGQSPPMGENPAGNVADAPYVWGVWAGLVIAILGGVFLGFGRKGRTPPA
jgi:hypothetical protein